MYATRWAPALLAVALCLGACCPDKETGPDRPWEQGDVTGYVPVYDNNPALKTVSLADPVKMNTPGKVLRYGHYLDPVPAGAVSLFDLGGSGSGKKNNNYYTAGSSPLLAVPFTLKFAYRFGPRR